MHQLYGWMCLGYYFFSEIDNLANFGEQGKSIVHAIEETMTEEEKWNVLLKREPNFFNELKTIRSKIEQNQIKITGKYEKSIHFGRTFQYLE